MPIINPTEAINALLPQDCPDGSINIQELPLHVVITVKINNNAYTTVCIKKVILDFNRESIDCYSGVLCHGCHLRDFKEPISNRPLGALQTVFTTLDKLNLFEWGILEYFMAKSKTSLAFYAPKECDLTREVYDGSIATACANEHHALTKFRQVHFYLWKQGINERTNCWV